MARIDARLADAVAGIPVLEDSDVIFEVVGNPKPFFNDAIASEDASKAKDQNYGIMVSLKLVKTDSEDDSKFIGKTFPQRFYLHNEGSLSITKRFVMACYGYAVADEDGYNEKYGEADASIDPDVGEVGEVYSNLVGKSVSATVKQKPRKDDPNLFQNVFNWRPVM